MRLDFESSLHLGRVTVWESGACEMDILEISTGNNVFYESH
ncbi:MULTISPECIES: immunity protein TriTu family protein [unclassified Nostoc]